MGYRLKSRQHHPPGSFQVLFPEIGQQKPVSGSFEACKTYASGVIKGNPVLAKKHDWQLDDGWLDNFIENQNVARCVAHGWTNFLVSDEAIPDIPHVDRASELGGSKKNASVVGALSRVKAGVGALIEMFGPAGKAVPPSQAEARAHVCKVCPLNGKGGLLDYFTEAAAKAIRTQLEILKDLKLRTTVDDDLGTCQGCGCYTGLKVHAEIVFISSKTTDETRAALDPNCWILKEENKT